MREIVNPSDRPTLSHAPDNQRPETTMMLPPTAAAGSVASIRKVTAPPTRT